MYSFVSFYLLRQFFAAPHKKCERQSININGNKLRQPNRNFAVFKEQWLPESHYADATKISKSHEAVSASAVISTKSANVPGVMAVAAASIVSTTPPDKSPL